MKIVYVNGEQPEIKNPSVFLAGPTPRDETPSWRPDAIEIFKKFEFDGQSMELCKYSSIEWNAI